MLINDLYTNKTPAVAEAIGDLGSSRDRGKSVRKWRKQRGLDEQGPTDVSRRGFLRGLAAFAASAAVPAPVVKLLSTPAGVATLPIAAGVALLKGIQSHLDQFDPEDDDDYYEAWEDMAGELGFEDQDAGDEYGESAQDQLADIVNLYRQNPELAAAQLIKHLQTNLGVSPEEVKPSLASRADDPSDWRYQRKQQDAKGVEIAQQLRAASLRWRNKDDDDDDYYDAGSNQIISTLLGHAADKFELDINAGIELWRQLAAQSGREGFDDAQEEIYLTLQDHGINPEHAYKATSGAADDVSDLAKVARLAGVAKGVGSSNNQAAASTVKHMGPVQYAKDTLALPAPTKPEFDLAPDLKQKEKVPSKQQYKKDDEQGMAEGSGGNWYIRVNGKILNDTKFKPMIFSSEDEARSYAMKLADKKRIPLSQIKLTKSWMDAPEQGVAEDDDAVAAFMARGGEIQRLKSAKPRKGERWQGSAHIGAAGGRGTKGRVSGLGANTGKSGKPVVTAEQGNPVAGQDFTMKDGAQMKWNPASKSWQQQAPVPGDDGGFDVVSGYDTDHTIDNGNKSTGTYTSTTIAKKPTTGQQQSLASWDHTDPKTVKNYSGTNFIDPQGNAEVQKNYKESKKTKVDEVSLGDYSKKAPVSRAGAEIKKFFGRDDPAAVAAADRTIANRTKGLARADARRQPYTAPPVDQDKQRRDLADKYPNIDELVRQAELRRDPQYDRADGQAYYDGRDAEQNYHRLKQIQRMIRGAELDEMDLGGVSQATDSDTGDVTTNFNQGPMSVSQTKTPGGYTKQTDQQFNLGTATLGARTVGPNIGAGQLAGTTTKTATNTATGQAKQQVKGVGFGGASGATVGKNYVGSSDNELARHAADSTFGVNEDPNQATLNVPGASFTADKSTNTLSGTTNVHGVDLTATRNLTPGGARTFSASTNVTPNLNIAATQKSADYSQGQLAGTKSVAAKYTDTTGALGKPGQQHTATRTAGVGFGGATGANVGKNYVDQYSVNESMDRLRHLAGIKQSRV